MLHRDSIPLRITVSGKVLSGRASPMYENGSFGDFARTFQIYFGKHTGDKRNFYFGVMMYRETTGWDWCPQKKGDLPGAGEQIAAIIEAWYE